jgi:hypothetical protein
MVYMLKDYIISMGIYISLIGIPKSSTNYIKWYCETISWKIQDCEIIKIRTHPQVIFFFKITDTLLSLEYYPPVKNHF